MRETEFQWIHLAAHNLDGNWCEPGILRQFLIEHSARVLKFLFHIVNRTERKNRHPFLRENGTMLRQKIERVLVPVTTPPAKAGRLLGQRMC